MLTVKTPEEVQHIIEERIDSLATRAAKSCQPLPSATRAAKNCQPSTPPTPPTLPTSTAKSCQPPAHTLPTSATSAASTPPTPEPLAHSVPSAAERVTLTDALGRILAEDIIATEYVPDFDRSTVDGYALRASDSYGCSEAMPAILTISGEILMGESAGEALQPGECRTTAAPRP